MITNIENFRKKLLFRSTHRGTKEIDLLLGGFFKENQNSLSEKELLEFEKILEFTDKLLSDWLIFEKPNDDLANFLISKKIKDFKIKP